MWPFNSIARLFRRPPDAPPTAEPVIQEDTRIKEEPAALAAELRNALLTALPTHLHGGVADLCRTLADVADGAIRPDVAQARLAEDRMTALVIQELAGRPIGRGRAMLDFGYNNTYGTVSIGDVAGGHIIKVSVVLPRLAPSVPFHSRILPAHYVARPEKQHQLKELLLADPATPGPGVVGVHGLPGSGKSAIAAVLTHDPEVQARFSGGVLWTTLGQEPDVLTTLRGWVRELGDYDFPALGIEAATQRLAALLRDKVALLVVDDTWRSEHVRPFVEAAGPRCRVLVTSRDAAVWAQLGAGVCDLGVMSPRESRDLLAKAAGPQPHRFDDQLAADLAREVGYLPLALDLAGRQLGDGVPWAELLGDLRAETARLEALTLPDEELSLVASFNLSLRRLSDEKRGQFAKLGVFPEDVVFTPAVVAVVWGTSEPAARDGLRYLRDKALVLTAETGEPEALGFRLHDVPHGIARGLIQAPVTPAPGAIPGLGLTLPQAHVQLLDRYRTTTPPGTPPWHDVHDDGYLYDHLVWHLEKAGRPEAIPELLWAEDAAGQNGWYEAREQRGQTSGYLADLDRARTLADADFAGDPSPAAMTQQIRFALIRASLNTLAGQIPAELLERLVHHRVWTVERALAYARYMPDAKQGVRSRIALLPKLAPEMRRSVVSEALKVARGIGDGWDCAAALKDLEPYLDDRTGAAALETARGINSWDYRAWALAGLAPYLDLAERAEALQKARDIGDEMVRVSALERLAPYLDGPGLAAAFETARGIGDDFHRASALGRLARYFDPVGRGAALAAARRINREFCRAIALEGLVPHLDPAGRLEALQDAREIRDADCRARALAGLAPHLDGPGRAAALEAARGIEPEWARASVMEALIPFLEREERREAFIWLRNAWSAWLLRQAQGARDKLIIYLPGKRERVSILCGPGVFVEMTRSIIAVGRWWP
jgi:hypothetical protein